jgi:hypothetical protein
MYSLYHEEPEGKRLSAVFALPGYAADGKLGRNPAPEIYRPARETFD